MFELSNANEDVVTQSRIFNRMPLDVIAGIIRESGPSAYRKSWGKAQVGVPFGYTNSLEGLIKEGRQYGTILAEPHWPCELTPFGSFFHRKPVTADTLAALPIRQLAAPSSHAYLWTPDEFLVDAIRVLDAWGFAYNGSLVWISPALGGGDNGATVQQFLLHGLRRDSPSPKCRPRSWIVEPRHSVGSSLAPYQIKWFVEQVSPPPRLNLFNEIVRYNWISWGQSVPRPFDPDEEDDWGPDEDSNYDDEICEREPDSQDDGLLADSPIIIDVEMPSRRMHT